MPYRPNTQRQGPPTALQLPGLTTSGPSSSSSCSPSPLSISTTGGAGRAHQRRRGSSKVSSGSAVDAPNVSEIVPGKLYISDLAFAEDAVHLTKYGITHVLSTIQDKVTIPPTSQMTYAIKHKQVSVADFPFAELVSFFPETSTFIANALSSEGKVLVHCHEGISRSCSVVSAYMMQKYGMSPKEALAYVKSKRKVANPNLGFVQQLNEYARDQLGQNLPAPVGPPSTR